VSVANPAVPGGMRLSPRKRRAALLLSQGTSIAATARRLRIGERTLRTWKGDSGFTAEVEHLANEAEAAALTRLAGAQDSAVLTLVEILEDRKVDPGLRVRVADLLLAHGHKRREADVERELAALRELLEPKA
jgi:transposase-like protein